MAASSSDGDEPITQINVIPLVDIVLVLLIVFMMTASFIIAPAVKVNLPQASQTDEPPPRNLHLIVDAEGLIHFGERVIAAEELEALVQRELAENPDLHVLVSADRNVAYGEVVSLLDGVRVAGVTKFAISVEGG